VWLVAVAGGGAVFGGGDVAGQPPPLVDDGTVADSPPGGGGGAFELLCGRSRHRGRCSANQRFDGSGDDETSVCVNAEKNVLCQPLKSAEHRLVRLPASLPPPPSPPSSASQK